jgi:hypothetical protein
MSHRRRLHTRPTFGRTNHVRRLQFEELERRRLLATYTVDDDLSDAPLYPGMGPAKTALGTITLRSAIQQINIDGNSDGPNEIDFADNLGPISSWNGVEPNVAVPAMINGGSLGRVALFMRLVLSGDGITVENIVVSGAVPADGIVVTGNHDLVANDSLGTDFYNPEESGESIYPDGSYGVLIEGSNNTVSGCVISGNAISGVAIDGGADNVIVSNHIGTDFAGTKAIPNAYGGVEIFGGASNNTIGGPSSTLGNLISGNASPATGRYSGVDISQSGTTGNVVEGNFIGTDISGTKALGNVNAGVTIKDGATDNTIGGTASGAGNLISGNGAPSLSYPGVAITGTGTTGNVLEGNLIGTDMTGTQALGNAHGGVVISNGAADNTIGGNQKGDRNVISGNNGDGIDISDSGTSDNIVQGNCIGTDEGGKDALSNQGDGVVIENGATDNTIGHKAGDTWDPGTDNNPDPVANVIAYNGTQAAHGVGIAVRGDNTTGNVFRGNSIFMNGADPGAKEGYTYNAGIDLGDDGRTMNTNPQNTNGTGPNGWQNFPISSLVKDSGRGAEIIGSIKSIPDLPYTLDFYSNDDSTLQDVRQGKDYIGSWTVTTNSDGLGLFDATLNQTVFRYQAITATATGRSGTSELEFMVTRPILVLPGIAGSLPLSDDYSSWLVQRGVAPKLMQLDPIKGTYNDLIQTLKNEGYTEGEDLFAAAYDWRIGVAPAGPGALTADGIAGDVVSGTFTSGVDYLGYWIQQAIQEFNKLYPDVPLDSVDIVAHSTGGLITRAYIQSEAYGNTVDTDKVDWSSVTTKLPKVNQFIMLGVPNRGSPKAFNPLNNNWIIDRTYMYFFSKVLYTAYKKLLAGKTIAGPTYSITLANVTTDGTTDGTFDYQKFIALYVPTIYDLLSIDKYLSGGTTTLSNPLLTGMDAGDNWTDFGKVVQQVTDIYGYGVETPTSVVQKTGPDYYNLPLLKIAKLDLFPFSTWWPLAPAPGQIWYKDQTTLDGDGTVPLSSSLKPFLNNPNFTLYGIDGVKHGGLPSDDAAQRDILQALGVDLLNGPMISHGLSKIELFDDATWHIGFALDPVGGVLTDSQGRQLGYTTSGGAVQQIPNSVFLGDATAGFGIAYGTGPEPTQFQLTGVGGAYDVFLGSEAYGAEATGTLESGQSASVTLDLGPPGAPTLLAADDSGTQGDGVTTVTRPRLTGTTLPGISVQLLNLTGSQVKVVGSTTADSSGTYVIQVPSALAIGTYDFAVQVTATSGQVSDPSDVTTVTILPGPTLTAVAGSGTFGGTGTLTANLSFNGSPVSGATVTFTLTSGTTVTTAGSATTNAHGVATLTGVSMTGFAVGDYPGAVDASVASTLTYSAISAVGDLTVTPAKGTFDVISTADDGSAGTLRWAIAQANSATTPSTIDFGFGSSSETITLTQGEIELKNTAAAITIDGPGAALLSISGGYASRVFAIDKGVVASLSGVTITEGVAQGSHPRFYGPPGGGLYNEGSVTISGCTLSDNSAHEGGGLFNTGTADLSDCVVSGNGSYIGGGLNSYYGPLKLTNCMVTGNSSVQRGGGVYAVGGTVSLADCTITDNYNYSISLGGLVGGGLFIGQLSQAVLTSCTVRRNAGIEGGGLFNSSGSALRLVDCTVSGNTALEGISSQPFGAYGGGLYNDGVAEITDSTISGNTALQRGGGVYNKGKATITSSTVSGNEAGYRGGGLYNFGGKYYHCTAVLSDTIVAGNTNKAQSASDIGGNGESAVTGSYNLVGTGGSGGLTAAHNNLCNVADPGLGPLANNGGPTETMALLPGSPAIGAGTTIAGVTTDQQGDPLDSPPDIGAYQIRGTHGSALAFAGLASPSVSYGTASVTLSGTLASGNLAPPNGESVVITLSGVTKHATLGAGGAFSAAFVVSTLGVSGSPYTITYSYAGDQTYAPTRATGSLTVSKGSANLALTSSHGSAVYGQPITFVATVTATGATPTGAVTFYSGSTPMGTVTLHGSDTAMLTISRLAPGSHSISAAYSGDVDFVSATSRPTSESIAKASTRVVIIPRGGHHAGKAAPIALTAEILPVAPGAGTPTGVVTVMSGKNRLASQALRGGQATFALSSKSLSNKALTVVYSGDADFRSATLSLPRLTAALASQLPATGGSYGTKNAGLISMKSALYNPITSAVTLKQTKPSARTMPAPLVINASGSNALLGTHGRYVDRGKNVVVYPAPSPVVDIEQSAEPHTRMLANSAAIDVLLEREAFVGPGRAKKGDKSNKYFASRW